MNLIIKTNPADWDDSLIVAEGLAKDGYALSSSVTQMKAAALPEPYLDVWRAIVEQLKGSGDGEVVCVMAEAAIVERTVQEEGEWELEAEVVMTSYWQYPDGRMLTPQTATLCDEPVVNLVEFLLDAEAYELTAMNLNL